MSYTMLPPVVLLLTCITGATYSETFSSVAHLRALLASDKILIQEIKDYIRMEEVRIKNTKRAVEELEDSAGCCGDLSHPLNALHSVRDWYQVTRRLQNAPDNYQYLQSRIKQTKLPLLGEGDYHGAINALLRLQATYNLNSSDLVKGNVLHGNQVHRATPLDSDSVLDIGLTANKLKLYNQAADWLSLSVSMVTKPSVQMILNLAEAYKQVGENTKALETLKRAQGVGGYNKRRIDKLIASLTENIGASSGGSTPGSPADSRRASAEFSRQSGEGTRDTEGSTPGDVGDPTGSVHGQWPEKDRRILQKNSELCRENINNAIYPHQRCTFQYYRVAGYLRYKAEVYSEEPWIVLYHDILSDNETRQIINMSTPQLERSVQGAKDAVPTPWRIAKTAWLRDNDHDLVRQLSQRVAMVTGLNTNMEESMFRSSAEPLQVVNYGIGGQYDPHYDCRALGDEVTTLPDRLATFLFYLNGVTAGGGTVFTRLGIRVTPVKNSALFWYNKKRAGGKDAMTLHAGCPVLIGEKWIANKWILELNNEFNRKCGINKEEPHHKADRNKMFIV